MGTHTVDQLRRYHVGYVDTPVVHLLDGPYVTLGTRRQEVPEGSKQLLAFVAVRRRRVERRHAAGTLWPFGDEARAAGNLRSALWHLRRAGIDVMVADKSSLALNTDVLVRANSRSLSVIQVTLGSHELECPDLVAADPFRGFLDGVHVFHAE